MPLATDVTDALLAGRNPWTGEVKVHNVHLADPACSWYPVFENVLRQRARGERANWLPGILCGQPDYFVPGRTPLMALGLALAPLPAFVASLWLQLALSGLAAWWLARELGAGRAAAAVAGVAFAYSLQGIAFLEMGHWAEATLALPVLLVALRRIALPPDGAGARWGIAHVLLAALAYAWIWLSNTNLGILGGYLAAAAGLGWTLASRRARAAKLAAMALAAALGIGMAAYELGPQLELVAATARPVFAPPGEAAPARDWVPALGVLGVSLVAPDLAGHPVDRDERLVPYYARPYFGVAPLVLALGALGSPAGRALWALVALVLLAATGGPVHRAACLALPGVRAIDAYRTLFWAMPLVPVLAARGLEQWRRWLAAGGDAERASARGGWIVTVAGAAFAVALLAAPLVPDLQPAARHRAYQRFAADTAANQRAFPLADRLRRADSFVERTAMRLGWMLALTAATLALLAAAATRRRAAGIALVALTAADLLAHGMRYTTFGAGPGVYPESAAAAFVRSRPGAHRVLPLGTYFVPNTALHYGLESVTGYDSIGFGGYEKLALAIGGTKFGHAFLFPEYPRDPVARRTLRLMGVRWVVSARPVEGLARVFSGDVDVYEDPGAAPRVRWYPSAEQAAGHDAALARLLDPAFDPDAAALVTLPPGAAPCAALAAALAAPRTPAAHPAPFTVVLASPDRLAVETRAPAPGVLVVMQRLLPGWHARIDGEPAPLALAQHSFTGVAVPAGPHRVELRYEPAFAIAGPRIAQLICGLAVLCLAAAIWYPARP